MYVGLDIGGTNIRLAAAASLSQPHLVHKTTFANQPDYEQNRLQIIKTIRSFGSQIQGLGISIAAEVNDQRTTAISATHLSHWLHQPLVEELAREFNCPVTMLHDQACAALGEATFGRIPNDFLWIGYGTGLGGAIIRRPNEQPAVQVIQGRTDYALFRDWERDCGGKSLEQEFGKPASQLSADDWQTVMRRFSRHLLLFILSQQPSAIVFGGGIAIKQAARLQRVCTTLQRAQPDLQNISFSIASLGEDAALYGGLALLRETFSNL